MTTHWTPCATLVGRPAAEFELSCTSGARHSRRLIRLQDFRNRWLILAFYPRDFSLVCPTELSAIGARFAEFAALGADVLAVSADSIESHERWIAAPRAEGGLGPISFPLASDPDGRTARQYGAWQEPPGVALRGLFVIDPNSVVQYQTVHNLNVGRRTDEVLRVLAALQSGGLCAENWAPGQGTLEIAQLKPGTVVSHYRIERTLGEGGFSTVYRAHDDVLDRKVALKILKRRQGWTPSVLREARAAAALNHQNVCTVFGIDDSEGIVMIVMEYLVGRPLEDLIAEGPAAPARVLELARQIARGMTAAHDAGIVHGDLKPANVFLTDDGVVKLLDFGLAARLRIVSSSQGTASLGTDECATVIGTPGYMSPEQADGGRASPASDVFAFGLILYELLTGKPAFDGSNILQILNEVRTLDPDTLADAVVEPLSAMLRCMLARNPTTRMTMHEVLDRLQEPGTP